MVHLGEVGPAVWDDIMDEMEKKLIDTNFKRHEVTPDWRKLAHRRKFEREAFSKYGYFKDLVLHPQVQLVKHFVEENARLEDVIVGEPFTSVTNVFILSLMLFRRLDSSIIMFLAAFLLSINPVYVSLAAIIAFAMKKRRNPKGYLSRKRHTVIDMNAKPLANEEIGNLISSKFDHILLGNDVATYYTAALLSRCGHKCIVVEPRDRPPIEIHPKSAPCPAPLVQCKVSKVERYQPLLDCVQSTDPAKRVVFAPVGNAEDGFTNAIVRIIAPSQILKSPSGQIIERKAYSSTLYCRPGEHAIVHFLCNTLSIEKSKLHGAFQKIRSIWPFLTGFLYSRCVHSSEWLKCSLSSNPVTKQFHELLQTSLDQYLFNCDIGEGKVHDALHALSCTIGGEEVLSRNELSSFLFGMASQAAESGAFVPIGGVSAIVDAFKSEICSIGGKIVCDVDSIKLEVVASDESAFKVTGVAIGCNGKEEVSIASNMSVVSGLGILSTYVGLLSNDIVSVKTRKDLVNLKEMKPKVKIVFWLEGTKEELGLSCTEFFQVVITQPVSNTETVTTSQSPDYCHIWSPSAMDPSWKHLNTQVVIVEMDIFASFVSLESVDWIEDCPGPMFFADIRNNHTNPKDPMFAEKLCRPLKLTKSKEEEFIRIAEKTIRQLYPLVSGNRIVYSHVEPPVLGGSRLANNTAKYTANFSAQTEIQNFYITGADLAGTGMSGDLQSGWVTANAILGYTIAELSEGRSVIQDMM